MLFNHHSLCVLALCLCGASVTANAQVLKQPASVIPWEGMPIGNSKHVPKSPAQDYYSNSPAWLITDAEPLSQPASLRKKSLPMVESENFANLGRLNLASASPDRNKKQQNPRSAVSKSQSFNLFHALGVQAFRPSDLQ